MQFLVKRLSQFATIPRRATLGSAGYDLSSAHAAVIPARGQTLVKTDLAISVPMGTYGRIAPRSGLALKGISIGAGVVWCMVHGCNLAFSHSWFVYKFCLDRSIETTRGTLAL